VEIDADDPYVYGLIGNFYVNKLVVKNVKKLKSGVSEVRLYNPGDGTAAEGLASMGQNFDQLSTQFRELASSTGRNFFLPIAQKQIFKPWNAADYLRACPDGSLYSYAESYMPFSQLPDYHSYKEDNAGSIYALEAF
jgi:hypothetical protein